MARRGAIPSPGTASAPAQATLSIDTQTFIANGTWTKPEGAVLVQVTVVSGGGGGGSGRRGAAGTVRCGGGGGGGGAYQTATFVPSALASSVPVTVGSGGTGAAAATTDDTNGNAGGQGNASLFGTYLRTGFAGGGGGGTNAAGAGGFASANSLASGTAGASASGTGGVGGNSTAASGGAGGGAGGGITSANVAAAGGRSSGFANGTGGLVDGTAPNNPGNNAAPLVGLAGGGGGAASVTTAAQAGAAGALYGTGGGGGGASTNGNASGAGGAGANGIVQVVTHILTRPASTTAAVTKLGVATSNTTTDLDAFLTASEQTQISSWMTFMPVEGGNFNQAITDIQAVNTRFGRTVPLELSWGFPGSTNLAGIAAGNDDAYITARAQQLQAYGGPVLLRLNWEMSGDWYNWSPYNGNTPRTGASPSDYVAAWRRIHGIVKATAPNAKFVWCPHLWVFHDLTPDLWYPGDAYVDWLGLDVYPNAADWSYIQGGPWGLDAWDTFATIHNLPIRFSEWGTEPGVEVGRFYQMKDWIEAHPNVRELVYFHLSDSSNGRDYRLGLYPDWAYAYRTWFTQNPTRYPQQ